MAPLRQRLTAAAIDTAVLLLLLVVGTELLFYTSFKWGWSDPKAVLFLLAWMVLPLAYLGVEVRCGRTLGKRLLRLRVANTGGGPARLGARWGRVAIKALPVLIATAVPAAEVTAGRYPLTDIVNWIPIGDQLSATQLESFTPAATLWRFAIVYGGVVPGALLLGAGMLTAFGRSRRAAHDYITGTAVFPASAAETDRGFEPLLRAGAAVGAALLLGSPYASLAIGANAPTEQPTGQAITALQAVRAVVENAARGGEATVRPPADEAERALFNHWLDVHRASVEGVTPGPLKDLPWGSCTYRAAAGGKPAALYLHVFDWHASRKLVVYGLGGGVTRAYCLSDPQHVGLDHSKTDRAVVVSLPKDPPDRPATVVVLELEGEPRVVPLAVVPSEDGRIVLHARDAIVHGNTLRYEPEPHKNTVGYWTDPKDWVSWPFEVTHPGTYDVEILQGCGKGSGGSDVDFAAAGQTLKVIVEDTGGFQNFVGRRIGQFRFDKPGRYELTVKPTRKPGLAVMDLRQVTLTPK